jgi:hypothetical protein
VEPIRLQSPNRSLGSFADHPAVYHQFRSVFPVRRLLSALTVATFSGGLLVVPVLTLPLVHPHAVTTSVAAVPVRATDEASGVLGRAAREHTDRFDLVGATWQAGTYDPRTTRMEVRVHRGSGWGDWQELEPTDTGADGGSADALRAARLHGDVQTAEPMWVGNADGFEARVVASSSSPTPAGPAALPDDLEVVLVDGGSSNADAVRERDVLLRSSTAEASAGRPEILTRADWGADESLRRSICPDGPDYSSTVRMGFVHHTDGTNGYSRSDVPSILRGIYAYHVRANGWCDVGYNFLIDRFGRIWEGRYGGITKAVLGAHTGGFNTNSFGTSLIGDFTGTAPSSAMLDAVERLFAWKLSRYYRDPLGMSKLIAGSFSGSRFDEGSTVTFDTVSGHRDADYTTCPGASAYRTLGDVRTGIKQAMGAGFVAPAQSASAIRMAGGVLRVRAGVIAKQTWKLTVTDAAGAVVQTLSGTASRSTKAVASWDLTGADGLPVLPGTYGLQLTGGNSAATAVPWMSTVTVDPPLALSVPAQRILGATVTPKGLGIPGHAVTVSVAGPHGTQQVGSFPVSDTGRWTASAGVLVDGDLSWTATDTAVSGYSGKARTRVGPAVITPAEPTSFVSAGDAVRVSGTALPGAGSPARLMSLPTGSTTATAGPALTVAPDGRWSTSITPSVPTLLWATDARGLASTKRLVYPVSAPTASAPDRGYEDRAVRVVGNAGKAPVEVTFSVRRSDGVWSTPTTRTADPDGRFAFRLPLTDAPGSVLKWRAATAYGQVTGFVTVQAVFPPTADGPARSAWNAIHVLTGRAVPGDLVTVQTAPPGGEWTTVGKVTARADETWSFPLAFTRDLTWRVRSPSGKSATGLTRIAPTLRAPSSVDAGTRVTLRGRAIPGRLVHLLRRTAGSTEWVEVTAVRAAADGTWATVRKPRRTADWRVRSHHQSSRMVTITVG